MYIYPDKRLKQLGTSLLNSLEMQLYEMHKINVIVTTINRITGPKNPENVMISAFKRGFKFQSADANVIILRKEF